MPLNCLLLLCRFTWFGSLVFDLLFDLWLSLVFLFLSDLLAWLLFLCVVHSHL